jgi:hypothetical protein
MDLASNPAGQYGSFHSKSETSKETVMKSIIALLCALSLGLSGIAFAGAGDPSQAKPPVDCKKDPTHPDCKAKK